jgi:hypothetical protein
MADTLTRLDELEVRAAQAEVVTWQGRQALRLENGLALVPGESVRDARIELLVGTEGPAYPGIAFRVADVLNYELAYAVPHASGQWDALQYDPVFHGSNTWQLYHGPGYQRAAQVPTGRWFRLRLDVRDCRTALSVDGQAPLAVEQLARPAVAGRLGVWTFRPAYFCEWRVSPAEQFDIPDGEAPAIAQGVIERWFVEGYGVVDCEPNGVVNLNRCLPPSMESVRLVRRFELAEDGEVTLDFGFSDVLSLELDGTVVYSGENLFAGFADRAGRGYAALGEQTVRQALPRGGHCLAAELEVREGFGWGLALAARGEGLRWLPAELG